MENITTMIAAATWAPAAQAPKACAVAIIAERAVPGSVPWSLPTC